MCLPPAGTWLHFPSAARITSCSAINSAAALYSWPALNQTPLCYCSVASPQLNSHQMKVKPHCSTPHLNVCECECECECECVASCRTAASFPSTQNYKMQFSLHSSGMLAVPESLKWTIPLQMMMEIIFVSEHHTLARVMRNTLEWVYSPHSFINCVYRVCLHTLSQAKLKLR